MSNTVEKSSEAEKFTLPHPNDKNEVEVSRQIQNIVRFYECQYLSMFETFELYRSLLNFDVSSPAWGVLYKLADDEESCISRFSLGPGPLFVCGRDENLCHYHMTETINVKYHNLDWYSDTAFFICRMQSDSGLALIRVYNTCCFGENGSFKVGLSEVEWKNYRVLFDEDIFSISHKNGQLKFKFKEATRDAETIEDRMSRCSL